MPTARSAAALILFAQLAAGGCERPRDAVPPEITGALTVVVDADGAQVPVMLPARRIVSLVPSATQTLAALGAQAQVAARTDFDTAAWVQDRPSVGGGLQPSLEAIVAARPDLVVRFGGPQDVQTPRRLDDLGIPHVSVRPDRIDDVLAMARLLGEVTGRRERADSLVAALDSTLAAVRSSAREASPVRVVYVLGGSPPWVAGPDTYIDELIELAGGTNVFADLGRSYAAASPEEFHGRDIDVVLLSRGTVFNPELAPGIPVVEVDPGLELPGPAMGASALEVARILERFR